MENTIYICGFGENDLDPDSQQKLDAHVSTWKSKSWSNEPYSPYDKRNSNFENVFQTFQEEQRADGKHIVIYGEITVTSDDEKNQAIQAVKELKSELSQLTFEVNDESGKVSV